MLSVFTYAFNAIASIFLISILGYILRQRGKVEDAFTGKLNSLIFRYFLSVNLFVSVYNIDRLNELPLSQFVFLAVYILLMGGLGLLLSGVITRENEKRSVLAQMTFRSNAAILGIPLAALLGGAAAEQYAGMFTGISVLVYNVLSVMLLTVYAPGTEHEKVSIKKVCKGVATNPLIIGVACGIVCLVIREILPKNAEGLPVISLRYTFPPVFNALSSMSKAASPMMLFILGARFDFSAVKSLRRYIISGVLIRNVMAPVVGYLALFICSEVLHLFDAGPVVYQGLIGILGGPCSISTAVMAAEMGADEALARQLVVWTSLCSMFTMFALISVLRMVGLM